MVDDFPRFSVEMHWYVLEGVDIWWSSVASAAAYMYAGEDGSGSGGGRLTVAGGGVDVEGWTGWRGEILIGCVCTGERLKVTAEA